jgi:predicted permease
MFRRRRKHSDFAAEIEAHLRIEQDRLHEQGLTEQEARDSALLAFGNPAAVEERFYESSRWMWLDRLRQDLRYSARSLARNPRFTIAAALTLALGIGANTAIFSAIDAVLVRPLPLPQSDRLSAIYSFSRKTGKYLSVSYPDYEDFARHTRSFEGLCAYVRLPLNLATGDHAERVPVEAVTTNYFEALKLPSLAGRAFRSEDDEASTASPSVMISEDLWRERFQGDLGLVGRTITLQDHPFTVIGIVPRRYRGTNLNWSDPPQLWIPLSAAPLVLPRLQTIDILHQRGMRWLLVLGRMRSGVTTAQAQAELRTLAAGLAQTWPTTNHDMTVMAFDASRSKFWPAYRTVITRSLAVFGAAAALVLLLACANVSHLLLERAMARRREIAIRLSIGAARGRLVRQLLTEDFLLVVPGSVAALAIAHGLQRVLLLFPNAFGLGLSMDLALDSRVLLFSLLLSFCSILLFGLAPALQTTRPELLSALKESGNALSVEGRGWLSHSLVALHVAFSMVLLVGGGLFARSLLKAYSVDLGFRTSRLLTLSFDLMQEEYSGERGRRFLETLVRDMSAQPGVESAALAFNAPLSGMHSPAQVADPDQPVAIAFAADANMVGPGFLHTLRIPLIAGRDYDSRDNAGAAKVAIVNQALARQLWPGDNAVGHTIVVRDGPGKGNVFEVVGVARDSRFSSVWDPAEPSLYLVASQLSWPTGNLILRTKVQPGSLVPALRRQWSTLAPRVPLDVRTGDDQLSGALTPQRVATGFLAAFGALAILLASVGLYSITAHAVSRRTREIGIRIAMGARPSLIVRQVVGRSFRLAAAGLVLGAAASAALMRLLASQIRNVSPYDTLTFGAAAVAIVAVSVAAALIPALRAAGIDPQTALKCE